MYEYMKNNMNSNLEYMYYAAFKIVTSAFGKSSRVNKVVPVKNSKNSFDFNLHSTETRQKCFFFTRNLTKDFFKQQH